MKSPCKFHVNETTFQCRKAGKENSLERKHEIIRFTLLIAIFFSIRTLWECNLAASKEKRWSSKSDVLKVLFPGKGKITNRLLSDHGLVIYPMSGNNATLKIDFTDPRKRSFVRSFLYTGSEMIHLP